MKRCAVSLAIVAGWLFSIQATASAGAWLGALHVACFDHPAMIEIRSVSLPGYDELFRSAADGKLERSGFYLDPHPRSAPFDPHPGRDARGEGGCRFGQATARWTLTHVERARGSYCEALWRGAILNLWIDDRPVFRDLHIGGYVSGCRGTVPGSALQEIRLYHAGPGGEHMLELVGFWEEGGMAHAPAYSGGSSLGAGGGPLNGPLTGDAEIPESCRRKGDCIEKTIRYYPFQWWVQ